MVVHEPQHRPLRVAGHRERDQVGTHTELVLTFDLLVRVGCRGSIGCVDPDPCVEALGVTGIVGDVVSVRQQDVVDPAELLHRTGHLTGPSRGVDHQVSLGAHHQVAVGPEGRSGVVAQPMDAIAQIVREQLRVGPLQGLVADRACRAHQQRPPGHLEIVFRFGLSQKDRQPLVVGPDQPGRHLSGCVAVDAVRVDVPVPGGAELVAVHGSGHAPTVAPVMGEPTAARAGAAQSSEAAWAGRSPERSVWSLVEMIARSVSGIVTARRRFTSNATLTTENVQASSELSTSNAQ